MGDVRSRRPIAYGARMHHRIRRLILASALSALALIGVATGTTAAERSVSITDFAFGPASISINQGDTVTWTNNGVAPHDAVGNGWSTPLLTAGQSASVTFNTVGTFTYLCTIHPRMTGRVVVRAAPSGGGPGFTDPPTDTVDELRPSGSQSDGMLGGLLVVVVSTAIGFEIVARRRATRA